MSSLFNNSSRFPFDCIIVTSPDESSAQSAWEGPLQVLQEQLRQEYPHQTPPIRVFSTTDPFGARVGSGGGTLAACQACESYNFDTNQTVLVLHAGGDSSRCPTQMILGKAWTSLASPDFATPTHWLIRQLHFLFHQANLPNGTLLVAATDCLAAFHHGHSLPPVLPMEYPNSNLVLGVAVPAPVTTAKNHGVFLLRPQVWKQDPSDKLSTTSNLVVETPLQVWQKPSIQKLLTTQEPSPATFTLQTQEGTIENQAWIDTGIVIFLPQAVQTLNHLADGLLANCTRKGLEQAYHKSNSENPDDPNRLCSLSDFAKEHALKVDLYTDIMHNLCWPNQTIPSSSSSSSTSPAVRQVLQQLPLQILVAPQGHFYHLGTTQELLQFATENTNTTTNTNVSTKNDYGLAQQLHLIPRHHSLYAPSPDQNVVLNSIFPTPFATAATAATTTTTTTTNVTIGKKSLVEHSILQHYTTVTVGANTLLSGWRTTTKTGNENHKNNNNNNNNNMNKSTNPTTTRSLIIPDDLSVQVLALKHNNTEKTNQHPTKQYAWMVLGMMDGIKANRHTGTLYNIPINQVLQITGLSLEELGWKDDINGSNNNNKKSTEDCLWTAKIHPIIVADDQTEATSFEAVFGWVQDLMQYNAIKDHVASFQNWRSLERVSLQELHKLSDATVEWNFRQQLYNAIEEEIKLQQLSRLLRERCHTEPCDDLGWMMDKFQKNKQEDDEVRLLQRVLTVLDQVARDELHKGRYDVSGRAFMVASALLGDLSTSSLKGEKTLEDSEIFAAALLQCSPHVERIRPSPTSNQDPSDRLDALDHIIALRTKAFLEDDKSNLPWNMAAYSSIMERLAFCMTEFCIWGGLEQWHVRMATEESSEEALPTLFDTWVMAMAPARIDLAGAWSDTPPVCYEFGGSVVGMAVLVDDHKPLSCRCRIRTNASGILLRTEHRDSVTGRLSSYVETELTKMSQMMDCRNPMSDCALIKCALLTLGMVSLENAGSEIDLQPYINLFCRSNDKNVRLEIISTSLLPQGSGLGTSSILGGCILAAITKCIGRQDPDTDYLFHAVLMLEQLLTSGGGYQDQVHGIVQGIKVVRSAASRLPLDMSVESIPISSKALRQLERRLILGFTGKTRLAKNILQNVLRRWARRTPEIVCTVRSLIEHSEAAQKALELEDLDSLGRILYQNWQLKIAMAGRDSGVEPAAVKVLLEELMKLNAIVGGCLCGAGGGGFMALLTSEGYDRVKIQELVNSDLTGALNDEELASFSWHHCRVCYDGLTTQILHDDDGKTDVDTFKLSWQAVSRQEDFCNGGP